MSSVPLDLFGGKVCSTCRQWSPYSEFNKNSHRYSRDGLSSQCKQCIGAQRKCSRAENAEALKQYRRERAEYYRENARRWAENNPERARYNDLRAKMRRQGITEYYTLEEWVTLRESYGNRCLRCGQVPEMLVPDHIIPASLGGKSTIDNIQPLCRRCNNLKHTAVTDYR